MFRLHEIRSKPSSQQVKSVTDDSEYATTVISKLGLVQSAYLNRGLMKSIMFIPLGSVGAAALSVCNTSTVSRT